MLILLSFIMISTPPAPVELPVRIAEVDTNIMEEDLESIGSFCSLACATWWSVEASSALAPQSGNSYEAEMLNDGDISTAWVEGCDGNGEGEEVRFIIEDYRMEEEDFEPVGYPLWGMTFLNGYRKNPEIWQANGRVRTALVSVNSNPLCVIELLDTMDAQFVSLPDVYVAHGDTISIEIIDVYAGTTWEDTAITELILEGAH